MDGLHGQYRDFLEQGRIRTDLRATADRLEELGQADLRKSRAEGVETDINVLAVICDVLRGLAEELDGTEPSDPAHYSSVLHLTPSSVRSTGVFARAAPRLGDAVDAGELAREVSASVARAVASAIVGYIRQSDGADDEMEELNRLGASFDTEADGTDSAMQRIDVALGFFEVQLRSVLLHEG